MVLITLTVSIRRADYWLVEGNRLAPTMPRMNEFQSAGRIIGWLKLHANPGAIFRIGMFQSAGRIIGWLKGV